MRYCGNQESLLGFAVYTGDIKNLAVELVSERGPGRSTRVVACLNPYSYVVANRNAAFRLALEEADVLIPDGSGIVLASRLHRGSIRRRLTGHDLFIEICTQLNNRRGGGKVFFVGSTPRVLAAISRRLSSDFPSLDLVGMISPTFAKSIPQEENDRILALVRNTHPDVIWVGMTAPKQEIWLSRNRNDLDCGVAVAIGAAFDFYARTVRRSPKVFRKVGMEWLPRLLREPLRLWRRTFVSAPVFLADVLKSCLCNKKGKRGD